MKSYLPLLGLGLLLSGCSMFRVPRGKPSHYDEAWASQTVRDANRADRADVEKNVKKGQAKE